MAVIAMEADRQGVPLEFMGGDQLNAPQGELPLPDGTIAVLAAGATPRRKRKPRGPLLKNAA